MLIQLDYFHPSLIGHQHMAKALWNSMLTPAARKRTYSNADEPFVCPDSSTLLYTNWSKIVTAHPNFCLCFVLLVHELKPFTFYFLTLYLAIGSTEVVREYVWRVSHTNYLSMYNFVIVGLTLLLCSVHIMVELTSTTYALKNVTYSNSLTVYKG